MFGILELTKVRQREAIVRNLPRCYTEAKVAVLIAGRCSTGNKLSKGVFFKVPVGPKASGPYSAWNLLGPSSETRVRGYRKSSTQKDLDTNADGDREICNSMEKGKDAMEIDIRNAKRISELSA